ncbi:MAG: hypothetical protein ACKPB0_06010 [Opitutaceae bacterium]
MKTLFLKFIASRSRHSRGRATPGGLVPVETPATATAAARRFRPPTLVDPPLPGRSNLRHPRGGPRLLPED